MVNSLVKQRRDAAEQFTAGGRPELADKEQAEIRFLQAGLAPGGRRRDDCGGHRGGRSRRPAPPVPRTWKVMKAVTAKLAGLSADGRAVSDAVKKRLAG